jgi:hypothetical protein
MTSDGLPAAVETADSVNGYCFEAVRFGESSWSSTTFRITDSATGFHPADPTGNRPGTATGNRRDFLMGEFGHV